MTLSVTALPLFESHSGMQVDSLKASAAAMAAENEALADDLLSKDEEIEQLTGQLVHAQKDLQVVPDIAHQQMPIPSAPV